MTLSESDKTVLKLLALGILAYVAYQKFYPSHKGGPAVVMDNSNQIQGTKTTK